jgi:excisionase family DNA binding protein
MTLPARLLPEQLEAALAPLHAELRHLRAELEEVSKRLPPRLGTLAEAAEILGCHPHTAWDMWKRGEIQGRRIGRAVRIDLAALRPATDEDVAQAFAGRRGR